MKKLLLSITLMLGLFTTCSSQETPGYFEFRADSAHIKGESFMYIYEQPAYFLIGDTKSYLSDDFGPQMLEVETIAHYTQDSVTYLYTLKRDTEYIVLQLNFGVDDEIDSIYQFTVEDYNMFLNGLTPKTFICYFRRKR